MLDDLAPSGPDFNPHDHRENADTAGFFASVKSAAALQGITLADADAAAPDCHQFPELIGLTEHFVANAPEAGADAANTTFHFLRSRAFASHARAMESNGWNLIPAPVLGKGVFVPDWSDACSYPFSATLDRRTIVGEDGAARSTYRANVDGSPALVDRLTGLIVDHARDGFGVAYGSLRPGATHGLIGLDIDSVAYAPHALRAASEIAQLAGASRIYTRGRTNSAKATALFRYNLTAGDYIPTESNIGKSEGSRDMLELFGTGRQSVVCNVHPTGARYRCDFDLMATRLADLPALDLDGVCEMLRRAADYAGFNADASIASIRAKATSQGTASAPMASAGGLTSISTSTSSSTSSTTSSTSSTGGDDPFDDELCRAAASRPSWIYELPGLAFHPTQSIDRKGSIRFFPLFAGATADFRRSTGSAKLNGPDHPTAPCRIPDFRQRGKKGWTPITLASNALGVGIGDAKRWLAERLGMLDGLRASNRRYAERMAAERAAEAAAQASAPEPVVEPVAPVAPEQITPERAEAELGEARAALSVFADAFGKESIRFNVHELPKTEEDVAKFKKEEKARAEIMAGQEPHTIPAGVWRAHFAAGAGKSTALQAVVVWLVMSGYLTRPLVYACHDTPQGQKVAAEIRAALVEAGDTMEDRVVEMFGRNKSNCVQHERVEALRKASPTTSQKDSLCKSSHGKCGAYDNCPFIKMGKIVKHSPAGRIIVCTHAMLYGYAFKFPANVFATIIDEDSAGQAAPEEKTMFADLLGRLHEASMNSKATAHLDEADAARCIAGLSEVLQQLRKSMGSLNSEALADREWMEANGITKDALAGAMACLFGLVKESAVELLPNDPYPEFLAKIEALKAHGQWVKAHQTIVALVEIITDPDGTSLLTATTGPDDFGTREITIRKRQTLAPKFTAKPIMALSATADETRVLATVGPIKHTASGHPALSTRHVNVEFVNGVPTSTRAAVEGSRTLRGVRRVALELHARKPGPTLIVTTLKAANRLKAMPWPEGVKIIHFAIAMGTNEFETYEKLVIYGQERPKPAAVENKALAITGQLVRLPPGEFYKAQQVHRLAIDGTPYSVTSYSHQSPLAGSFLDLACNDAIAQAFARLRPLNAPADGRVIDAIVMTSTLPDTIIPTTARQWGAGRESLIWEYTEQHGFFPVGSDRACVALAPDLWMPKRWKGATDEMLMADAVNKVGEAKRAEGYPTRSPLRGERSGVLCKLLSTPDRKLRSGEARSFIVRQPNLDPWEAIDPHGALSADDVLTTLRERMGDDVLVDGATATKASMSADRVGACSTSRALMLVIDPIAYPNADAFKSDKAGTLDPVKFAASRKRGVVYNVAIPRSPKGPQPMAIDLDHEGSMGRLVAVRHAFPKATITRTSGEPESLPHALLREFVSVPLPEQEITLTMGALAFLQAHKFKYQPGA